MTITTTFTSVAGATGTDPRAADTVGSVLVARADQAFSWTAVGTVDAGCRVFLDYSDNGGAAWRVLKEWGPGAINTGATERFPAERYFRFRASVDNDATLASFAATLTESTVLLHEVRSAEGALIARFTSGGAEFPNVTATNVAANKVVVGAVTVEQGSVKLTGGSIQHQNGTAAGVIAQAYGKTIAEGLQTYILEETISFAGNVALYKAMTATIPAGSVILSAQANIESALTGGGTTVKVGLGLNASDPDKYGLTSVLTKNAKISTIPAHAVLAGATRLDVCACATAGGAGNTALTVGSVRVRVVFASVFDLVDA